MSVNLVEDQSYERKALTIDHESGKITVRASNALSCRRQLWYSGNGLSESNPSDRDAILRMTAGQYLEPLVREELEHRGWAVEDGTDSWINVEVADGVQLTGHYDALGGPPDPFAGLVADYEPDIDNESKVSIIEIKTTGGRAARNIESANTAIEITRPTWAAQAALYALGLNVVDNGAYIVVFDTDKRRLLEPMFVRPESLRHALANVASWLAELRDHIGTPDGHRAPRRDFTRRDWQCRFCSYKDRCWEST